MEKALGKAAYKAATNATIKKLALLREVIAESSKRKEQESLNQRDQCQQDSREPGS